MPHQGLSALSLWLLLLGPTSPVFAQGAAVNLVEVLYGTGYDGRVNDRQSVLTFRHTAPWAMGDNFFFVDFSNAGNYENAGNAYVEWGPRLSLGRTLSGEPWRWGLISDVYLVGELNHSRTKAFSHTVPLVGLSVDLAIKGFRVLKLHLEHRDDSRYAGTTEQMSLIWNYPFTFAGKEFSIEGFADLLGPEGTTHGSFHMQPQLVWRASPRWNFGVEYQYWRNKLGRAGLTESVMQGMVRVYF